MPQIQCYLKADGNCPNAANSVLPLSWRWVSQCRKLNVTLKLTVSFHMLQIHRYLKADGECPNVTNLLLPQSWRWVSKCRKFILPVSWRWVFRCRKVIVTSKLTVSVQMPQIHFYLKADGECPNAAKSLLPQSWRWLSQCQKFIVTSKLTVSVPMPQMHCYLKADGECPNAANSFYLWADGECSDAVNSLLPQSWRWVSKCRKFIVTSKLTVSVQMPQIHFTYKLTVSVPMPQINRYLKAHGEGSDAGSIHGVPEREAVRSIGGQHVRHKASHVVWFTWWWRLDVDILPGDVACSGYTNWMLCCSVYVLNSYNFNYMNF